MKNRVIEYKLVKPKDIVRNDKNHRLHPEKQSKALKAMLDEIGIAGALLCYYSERDGGKLTLIDGELRKNTAPGEEWPVLITDLTDQEADLLLAGHDYITELADVDKEKLDALLRDIHTDSKELQEMLAGFAEESGLYNTENKDAEPQIDKAEELRIKWNVETGQLWKLGDHRIICGDCTDARIVQRLIDIPLNILVTDPPYGVEYDANWRNEAAEKGLLSYAARRIGKVNNDTRDDWTEAWKLFDGDVIYCWHAGLRASNVQNSLESVGFQMRAQIIWEKPHFVIGRGHYTPRHEPCWYCVRKGKQASWIGENLQTTMWKISLDRNVNGGHSTQKPLECMLRPIKNHSGDVYEPFSGSGTTIIACENLGRKCRAIEISPAYVAVAIQRWVDVTGKEPILLNSKNPNE